MVAKVKYPVRAALARVLPISNHLIKMQDYLLIRIQEAGKEGKNDDLANLIFNEISGLRSDVDHWNRCLIFFSFGRKRKRNELE